MNKQIEAIYENGMLRPLEALPLSEQQRVSVIVTTESTTALERSHVDVEYQDLVRKRVAAMERSPSLEEVQEITSKDPSSWSDAIIAEREGRL
jgi:predicted DNA-binding antitoxin AbrB/MazE fold protein